MRVRSLLGTILTPLLVGGLAVGVSPSAIADSDKLKAILARAESHERSYEWDKAYSAYDEAIKFHRGVSGLRDRQTTALRRFWQEQRHKDAAYRKEVLSLDYSQAMRLNGAVFDTLFESSLPAAKSSSGVLLKKGIEELETALRDPGFVAAYLPAGKPAAIAAFRDFLGRKKSEAAALGRAECMKAIREVALAGQTSLDLNPTVSLMELACGACYGVDEYTAYLTPTQFRDLSESLKADPMEFGPSVHASLKTMGIGCLQITHFQESTPAEVDEAFHALSKLGAKGFIIDLRGNPGGLVESAIEVARRFLANGVIGSTESYDPKLSAVYHARNTSAWTVPLVLLVDGETASAAEVLAGALKDNGRARVLGQPTYGKGTLQSLVKLPDALGGLPTGGLRLTIARFFSPKGLPYSGLGVVPDLTLEMWGVLDMGADPHIVAAIEDLDRRSAR